MPRPPRLLVLSASVGGGHLRAAQAVTLALRELAPAAEIRELDILELAPRPFRRVYADAYLGLVDKAPAALGLIYDALDRRGGRKTQAADRLRLLVERVNLRAFERFLQDGPWDGAVNTHFLPTEIIAALRRKGALRLPQLTVTTDFETHRLWVYRPCELFTTATEEGAATLRHWGVPAAAVRVTGIPVHPAFCRAPDKAACRKAFSLTPGRPVVLQLAGGFGVGPVERIYRGLLSCVVPLQVVAVAGRSAELRARLGKVPVPPRHAALVLGFTDRMHELMAAADLVVSKPGGLTTSEALASGVPMAVVNPIPGQEARNSDFLLENGAAVKINTLETMGEKLGRLLGDARRLKALGAAARGLGRPRAAFEVARLALGPLLAGGPRAKLVE